MVFNGAELEESTFCRLNKVLEITTWRRVKHLECDYGNQV